MKKQYIQFLQIAREEGIEVLKAELEKMEKEEIKKAAKANGNNSTYGRSTKEQIIEIILNWINSKLHYGECFRLELIKELEEDK